MKCDVTTKIYQAMGIKIDQTNVNKYVERERSSLTPEREQK